MYYVVIIEVTSTQSTLLPLQQHQGMLSNFSEKPKGGSIDLNEYLLSQKSSTCTYHAT